jgi:lipopolysaccharide transport system permease protein/teichoic acid transport system permease protein
MARREVKGLYAASFLGAAWTFIHPLVLIFVFWFVFSVGFKAKPMNNVPFVVWLTAGMMPWFLFSEILSSSAGVVVGHANLIKKTLFPSQILPMVRIVAGLVTHFVFLLLLIGLLIFQHIPFTLYFFQFFYYSLCLCLFVLGLSWMLSALNVFIRDISQLVAVVVQIGFWVTPIFWDLQIMPHKAQFFLKLNPMYYIVQGYRDSFIYGIGFWHHPYQTLYFWLVCTFTLFVGIFVFQRLRPQFADVL